MIARLRRALQTAVPAPVGAKLDVLLGDLARPAREAHERALPRPRLSERHVANCEVLLDRRAMLAQVAPGSVVAEVGVDRGAFSRQILDVARPAELHLVDVWASERYHEGLYRQVTAAFADEIAAGRVHVHRGASVAAAPEFADGTLDWVYIDTDHSYETTRDELAAYAPKVAPGGVLAGHDYLVGNWVAGNRYGVMEAVHEFCVARDWELVALTAVLTEKPSFAIRRIGDA